jgi:hypothetical protein
LTALSDRNGCSNFPTTSLLPASLGPVLGAFIQLAWPK